MKKIFAGIGIVLLEIVCTILYLALIIIASDNEANWTFFLSGSLVLLSISGTFLASRLDSRFVITEMVFFVVLSIWMIVSIVGSKVLDRIWFTYLVMLLNPVINIIIGAVLLNSARRDKTNDENWMPLFFFFCSILYEIAIIVLFCSTVTPYFLKLALSIIGIVFSIISLLMVIAVSRGRFFCVSRGRFSCQGDKTNECQGDGSVDNF